jgi:hypothetical protein
LPIGPRARAAVGKDYGSVVLKRIAPVFILALVLVSCGGSVLTLDVGTCFDDPASFAEVTDVPVVACADPHDNEVIAVFTLSEPAFPGEDVVNARAGEGCVAAFEPYVGIAYAESIFDVGWFAPSADSWAIGDREVICFAFDLTGAETVGSISGTGR